MSSRDIAKFHKYLKQDIPIGKISKSLGVTTKTLEKFKPDVVAKVKKEQKAAAVKATAKPVEKNDNK